MQTPQQLITTIVDEALRKLNYEAVTYTIEVPAVTSFGDLSTNVAMVISKHNPSHPNPREVASKFVDYIQQNPPIVDAQPVFANISIAGPGFINFFFSNEYLLIESMTRQNDFSSTQKKIIVEYMQPNTNKPLHVGHLRNALLGIALINILRKTGNDVVATTINNDRGLHIIKSMWAYLRFGSAVSDTFTNWQTSIVEWQKDPKGWIQPEAMENKKLQKPDFFVGYWYVKADEEAENQEITSQWSEMLIAWEDSTHVFHIPVRQLWEQMNAWFYVGAEQTYTQLGVTFDKINYESAIYQAGKQIILENIDGQNIEKLPDGAVRANLEATYSLPNKILLRKDGTSIYMTFDLELTRQRAATKADQMIWIVGKDQELYFQQLFAICEILGFGSREKFHHFAYGMVRLPEGKMSSRKGIVVYADDVVADAIKRARVIIEDLSTAKSMDQTAKEIITRQIGLGAVKYALLSYDPLSDVTFSVEQSVSFEGNSGPYLQYTAVRARSILSKVKTEHHSPTPSDISLSSVERQLAVVLTQFPSIVLRASSEFSPHLICTYLYYLAQSFNTFYTTHRVVDEGKVHHRRVELTRAVVSTLEQGLSLLGIEVPLQM